MKHLFLLIAIMLFSLTNISAQEINDTSKVTFTKVYNDVKQGITALGQSLKVGGEHVYVVLCKQQLVTSISYTILFISLFTVLGLILIKSFKAWKKTKFDEDSPVLAGVVLSSTFLFISFIFFMLNIDNIVMGYINPEYGAIKEIIDFVKK